MQDHPEPPAEPGIRCIVVIPAYNEQDSVGSTVAAASELPGVHQVVVVDDGSGDDTALVAQEAGATVVELGRRSGKGAALQAGVDRAVAGDGAEDALVILLDADLKDSAREAAVLIEAVRSHRTDVAIATLPRAPAAGGLGLVVGLSRWGIRRCTSWEPAQPLSGQRCLPVEAFRAVCPLAAGFGVETAMTIDLLRRGYQVREIETNMAHRVTGKDLRSNLHRARQLLDVARALAPRMRARDTGSKRRAAGRSG